MSFSPGQVVRLTPEGCQQLHKEPYDVHVGFGVPLDLSLATVPAVIAAVVKLINQGLTVAQAAEKIAAWVDPSAVPALDTLIEVLQAAAALVNKA